MPKAKTDGDRPRIVTVNCEQVERHEDDERDADEQAVN